MWEQQHTDLQEVPPPSTSQQHTCAQTRCFFPKEIWKNGLQISGVTMNFSSFSFILVVSFMSVFQFSLMKYTTMQLKR